MLRGVNANMDAFVVDGAVPSEPRQRAMKVRRRSERVIEQTKPAQVDGLSKMKAEKIVVQRHGSLVEKLDLASDRNPISGLLICERLSPADLSKLLTSSCALNARAWAALAIPPLAEGSGVTQSFFGEAARTISLSHNK